MTKLPSPPPLYLCTPQGHKVLNVGATSGESTPCQCNGRADSCKPDTGFCINCTDNTAGRLRIADPGPFISLWDENSRFFWASRIQKLAHLPLFASFSHHALLSIFYIFFSIFPFALSAVFLFLPSGDERALFYIKTRNTI